ncbi:MAG: hypothetical protein ABI992_03340 [Chthoniobacterales bacterium]
MNRPRSMFAALKHGVDQTHSTITAGSDYKIIRLPGVRNMNRKKIHDETINYHDPLTAIRRGRRSFALRTFNDRSPEVLAMNAHLRAGAYGGRATSQPMVSKSARSFLNLGREYDAQARDNFAKETVIFAVIIIAAVAWPFIQGMRVFFN